MSAAVETYRDDVEATYAVDFSRDREPMQSRKRFPEYRRKGGAPTRVSGMHCRRSKRWTWGSGRGARMLNTRAFAGAVAFAVASVASTVLGVTMDMIAIGNAGNIGNPGSSPSGLGAVPYLYLMSSKETTNTDYVAFLNAVDPNGTQTVGIFQPQMQSDARGGIAFDAAGTVGAKYSVKPGSLQPNGSYATMPANYINWFSAARFVNWLHNGQQNSAASMENGSYTLNGITSGSVVPRNPGATFVLPTVDEWYKAAFFDGSAYTQYQTNSNVAPTASLNIALANVGNFANISSGPMDVATSPRSPRRPALRPDSSGRWVADLRVACPLGTPCRQPSLSRRRLPIRTTASASPRCPSRAPSSWVVLRSPLWRAMSGAAAAR
jgi:hypothetical protein